MLSCRLVVGGGGPLHLSTDLFSRACSLVDMASSVHVKDSCKSKKTYLRQALSATVAEF